MPAKTTKTRSDPTARTGKQAAPRRRQRLHPLHLIELREAWNAYKKVPSLRSRHEWANARNLQPILVHHWFGRQKGRNNGLPDYDLPVGTPPDISAVVVKPEPAYADDTLPAAADALSNAEPLDFSRKDFPASFDPFADIPFAASDAWLKTVTELTEMPLPNDQAFSLASRSDIMAGSTKYPPPLLSSSSDFGKDSASPPAQMHTASAPLPSAHPQQAQAVFQPSDPSQSLLRPHFQQQQQQQQQQLQHQYQHQSHEQQLPPNSTPSFLHQQQLPYQQTPNPPTYMQAPVPMQYMPPPSYTAHSLSSMGTAYPYPPWLMPPPDCVLIPRQLFASLSKLARQHDPSIFQQWPMFDNVTKTRSS
ncbi:hypothetical protein EXIGLDRAFT_844163 [Exidia glandulosa HHB12029]|uniref:Homeobox domain-containing protein n=1 Tax=Exidia glandulosa HHB12029 TaxID=1314781 RepID=A0A165C7C0_EXIGL|nr:hypothetical protein EXIGLDRAFT_844163 [Exidia glandulosa HHB12029]